MPIFVLKVKAEMEGIAKFWIPEDHVWELDLQESAGSEVKVGVRVDPDEEQEIPNSKGATANCLIKFPGAKSAAYIKVTTLPKLPKAQTSTDNDKVAIAAFECRGLEPKKWTPTGPYCVESEGGTVFDEVGFKDNEDWCDYDEKAGVSMMLGKDIAHEFVLHRG